MKTTSTLSSLVSQYITLREQKSQLAKEYENKKASVEAQMEEVSDLLMAALKEADATSIKTTSGTVIRSVKTRYWTADWESMHEFIRDNDVPEFYEKRLNQREVRAYLEENPEAAVPGLNADSAYSLTVRRA